MTSLKMSPAGDSDTLAVLNKLAHRQLGQVIDAGCGKGRQTLVLAAHLGTEVHAIDINPEHLNVLRSEADALGLSDHISLHEMNIGDIPSHFNQVDLLWSEASAYCIGFDHALRKWREALAPKSGYLVVSELCFLADNVTEEVREYLGRGYPDIAHRDENLVKCQNAGYEVVDTYTVPKESWFEGYYDDMSVMAQKLIGHPDPAIRQFAEETLFAIEFFLRHHDSFSYVYYILRAR